MQPGEPTKGERTRHRLLDIAVRQFTGRGYREASIAAVAREAGLTAGAVYPYFRTKEELFLAAVERESAQLIAEAGAAADDAAAPAVAFALALLGSSEHHPLLTLVLREPPPELLGRVLELEPFQQVRVHLRRRLRSGQEQGAIRGDLNVDQFALGLESIVLAQLSAAVPAGPGETDQPEARRREAVAAVITAALLPPPR